VAEDEADGGPDELGEAGDEDGAPSAALSDFVSPENLVLPLVPHPARVQASRATARNDDERRIPPVSGTTLVNRSE